MTWPYCCHDKVLPPWLPRVALLCFSCFTYQQTTVHKTIRMVYGIYNWTLAARAHLTLWLDLKKNKYFLATMKSLLSNNKCIPLFWPKLWDPSGLVATKVHSSLSPITKVLSTILICLSPFHAFHGSLLAVCPHILAWDFSGINPKWHKGRAKQTKEPHILFI